MNLTDLSELIFPDEMFINSEGCFFVSSGPMHSPIFSFIFNLSLQSFLTFAGFLLSVSVHLERTYDDHAFFPDHEAKFYKYVNCKPAF